MYFLPALVPSSASPALSGVVVKRRRSVVVHALRNTFVFRGGSHSCILWFHCFRFGRQPFMLALAVREAVSAGFVIRILVSHNPTSKDINIASTLLILLSPCLSHGADYMFLGRISAMLGPQVASTAMFIAPAVDYRPRLSSILKIVLASLAVQLALFRQCVLSFT
ncbi:hypothetical protein B0H10DRAFT_2230929 [Mycena sp. CBHHK59/15]|nr:hypothetical protein B0H10DRAFT_2230929 [Mycena sp. CBHHK59/15]